MLASLTLDSLAHPPLCWRPTQDSLLGGDYYRDPGPTGHNPAALWPGTGQPGLWMEANGRLGTLVAAAARAAASAGEPLGAVPPVFVACSQRLARRDEVAARDLYWDVVTASASSPPPSSSPPSPSMGAGEFAAGIAALEECSRLNPFVGEPHVVRAQLLLAKATAEGSRGGGAGGCGDGCAAAATAAESGLALLGAWGCAWDKRVGWGAWVAWARVLAQRAAVDQPWPASAWDVVNLGLVKQPPAE